MRRPASAIFVSLLILGLFGQARGEPDRWLAEDKLHHLMVSAFLVGHSYRVYHDGFDHSHGQATQFATLLTISLGIGKEAYDGAADTGTASLKDLVADAIGIGLGLLLFTGY